MKSHYPKPQVGMEVFVVGLRVKTNQTIKSVGSKWVSLPYGKRFNKKTWELDGGGNVYPSEQYYLEERDLNNAWDELITSIRCIRMPKDMTVEKIKEIRKIMGIDQ